MPHHAQNHTKHRLTVALFVSPRISPSKCSVRSFFSASTRITFASIVAYLLAILRTISCSRPFWRFRISTSPLAVASWLSSLDSAFSRWRTFLFCLSRCLIVLASCSSRSLFRSASCLFSTSTSRRRASAASRYFSLSSRALVSLAVCFCSLSSSVCVFSSFCLTKKMRFRSASSSLRSVLRSSTSVSVLSSRSSASSAESIWNVVSRTLSTRPMAFSSVSLRAQTRSPKTTGQTSGGTPSSFRTTPRPRLLFLPDFPPPLLDGLMLLDGDLDGDLERELDRAPPMLTLERLRPPRPAGDRLAPRVGWFDGASSVFFFFFFFFFLPPILGSAERPRDSLRRSHRAWRSRVFSEYCLSP